MGRRLRRRLGGCLGRRLRRRLRRGLGGCLGLGALAGGRSRRQLGTVARCGDGGRLDFLLELLLQVVDLGLLRHRLGQEPAGGPP